MSEKSGLATEVVATRAKPAYAGRTVPDKSAKLSRAVAENPRFFLVRDGGLCSCSSGFNRHALGNQKSLKV